MNNKLNYPNWLVSPDIAQELKAIGFHKSTMFYLIDASGQILLDLKNGGENLFCVYSLDIEEFLIGNYNEETFNVSGSISAPTWEQVFEWFREKGFNAWIEYQTLYENYIPKLAVREEFIYIKNNKGYKTYEKAREALVVTLIQTYKREQL